MAAAYTILDRQQNEATALAGEASRLIVAARAFLKKAGLARLLTAGLPSPENHPANPARGENPDLSALLGSSLADAYATAAMEWARILSMAEALGEAFIRERAWDSAQRILVALEEVGETAVSKRLQRGLRNGRMAEQHQRLAYINDNMSASQVIAALAGVRASLEALRAAGPGAAAILIKPMEYINVSIGKQVLVSGGRPIQRWYFADPARPAIGDITGYLQALEAYLPALRAERERNHGRH